MASSMLGISDCSFTTRTGCVVFGNQADVSVFPRCPQGACHRGSTNRSLGKGSD